MCFCLGVVVAVLAFVSRCCCVGFCVVVLPWIFLSRLVCSSTGAVFVYRCVFVGVLVLISLVCLYCCVGLRVLVFLCSLVCFRMAFVLACVSVYLYGCCYVD